MRRCLIWIVLAIALTGGLPAGAAIGKVNKVLPHFLDLNGRHSRSPSLFDRDAYQAKLRKQPELCSGIRFDIHWRVRSVKPDGFKLKVELRGAPRGDLAPLKTLEQEVTGGVSARWTGITFGGDEFKQFGEITAWRVTLWDGDQLLGEQKSFLW
jgi:hypothetical protein